MIQRLFVYLQQTKKEIMDIFVFVLTVLGIVLILKFIGMFLKDFIKWVNK